MKNNINKKFEVGSPQLLHHIRKSNSVKPIDIEHNQIEKAGGTWKEIYILPGFAEIG
jgi:hypothetical protein